jgi:hypothetical protein
VLTAAHCSVGFPYGYTEVIAGRSNLETQGSGFVARVAHVQEIAAAYKGDKARIRAHVDKVFLTWFYLS